MLERLFGRDISVGCQGDDVQFLLAYLWRENGSIGLFPDWKFGEKGKTAVELLQARLGIPATGIFCSATRKKLKERRGEDFDAIPARPNPTPT